MFIKKIQEFLKRTKTNTLTQSYNTIDKNTYIVEVSFFSGAHFFADAVSTPLAVIEKNGKKVQNVNNGWLTTTQFPNPGANELVANYDLYSKKIGKKEAGTILEYLDKDTKKPVVLLFPTNSLMINHLPHNVNKIDEKALENRLSKPTLEDLYKEIEKRNSYITKLFDYTK